MGILCFVAGILPCYIDAENQREGTLFPLSTERIKYTGNNITRKWHSEDGEKCY
jgi:hypothetical protein